MAHGFVPVRRIAALSVTITLFTAPITWAQAPGLASNSEAPANTILLSHAAFARLVQTPRANVAPPVVADSPRPNLVRQLTTAMARDANAAFTKAPQQKSWASRHKVALSVLIGVGAFLGIYFGSCSSYSDGIVCPGFG